MKSSNLKIRKTIHPELVTRKLVFCVIQELVFVFHFFSPVDVFHQIVIFGNPS